jgi:hypothetical protein
MIPSAKALGYSRTLFVAFSAACFCPGIRFGKIGCNAVTIYQIENPLIRRAAYPKDSKIAQRFNAGFGVTRITHKSRQGRKKRRTI